MGEGPGEEPDRGDYHGACRCGHGPHAHIGAHEGQGHRPWTVTRDPRDRPANEPSEIDRLRSENEELRRLMKKLTEKTE